MLEPFSFEESLLVDSVSIYVFISVVSVESENCDVTRTKLLQEMILIFHGEKISADSPRKHAACSANGKGRKSERRMKQINKQDLVAPLLFSIIRGAIVNQDRSSTSESSNNQSYYR